MAERTDVSANATASRATPATPSAAAGAIGLAASGALAKIGKYRQLLASAGIEEAR